jgi:hypothetical protein
LLLLLLLRCDALMPATGAMVQGRMQVTHALCLLLLLLVMMMLMMMLKLILHHQQCCCFQRLLQSL